MTNWRISPSPIPMEQIYETHDCEVLVIGLGPSGTAAFRASAEAGAKTIAIDIQPESKYRVMGHNIGHINSQFLEHRGVPKVDEIEFFNDWMLRSGNRANPSLVMKFVKNSGSAFDWFTDGFSYDKMDETVVVGFWPSERIHRQLGGYKFWVGTATFQMRYGPGGKTGPTLEDISEDCHKKARALGSETYFGMEAMQLVKKKGRVIGAIAKNSNGNYVYFHASRGVILASGDFSANKEMLDELCVDMADICKKKHRYISVAGPRSNGRGIQMGVWAGGRLEARPLPTMGGNYSSVHATSENSYILLLDSEGKRYCNEGLGDVVFTGFPGNQMRGGRRYHIFDSGLLEDVSVQAPSHGNFDASSHIFSGTIERTMQSAVDAIPKGIEKKGALPGSGATGPVQVDGKAKDRSPGIFAGNTIEELCDHAGISGTVQRNIIASFNRYNELASKGKDEDFGKDACILRPLNKAPYFLEEFDNANLGFMLVTVGGLLTDENQNVLDEDYIQIPGLYATGNCCGRRFGLQYSTPIAGVSLGIAITLGREVGKVAAMADIESE